MQRRDLLKASLAAAGSTLFSSQLFAAPAASNANNRLLLIFLRGGYDASHLLIPTSSNFYYEARPNIAIARPSIDNENAALELNADWGLHPALRNSIYPLFQNGEASFIPFAGTDDLSRSHFETQDSIELGQNLNGTRNFHSGFFEPLSCPIKSRQRHVFHRPTSLNRARQYANREHLATRANQAKSR